MGPAAAASLIRTKARLDFGVARDPRRRTHTAVVQDSRQTERRANSNRRNSPRRARAGRLAHRLVALSSDAISGRGSASLLDHPRTRLAPPRFGAGLRGVLVPGTRRRAPLLLPPARALAGCARADVLLDLGNAHRIAGIVRIAGCY